MKKIHRLFLIALLAICGAPTFSQVNINIQVRPPYQSRIAEYASRPDLILLTLTNTSQQAQRVQLTGSITGDNGVSLTMKPSFRSPSPIELAPGQVKMLNSTDIHFLFDYSSIIIKGIDLNNVIYDARLTEGNYQICIRALDYDTRQPLSPEEPMGCALFYINDLEPPIITSPQNGIEMPNTGVTQAFPITWLTPPGASPSTQYTVKMVEIIANRDPNDAMRSATTPPFFERTVTGVNSILYGPADPALTAGRQYAVMVQANDPAGQSSFRKAGQSEVYNFTYGDPAIAATETPLIVQPTNGEEPECADCATDAPGGRPQNNLVKTGVKINVGEFVMTVNSVRANGETLSGEGVIPLTSISSAARLRVEFADMKVNDQLQMIAGRVRGKTSGEAAGFMPTATPPDVPSLGFDPAKAAQLGEFFKQRSGQLIDNIKNSVASAGFELPFGYARSGVTLGITSVTFSPTKAWFEMAGAVRIPDGQQQVLALSGKYFCLNATEFCKTGRVYLAEDFTVLSNFTLKKPGNNATTEPGTYIEFDKNGFKNMGIDVEYSFHGALERADDGTPLVTRFTTVTENGWSDWVATVQMPDFRISGLRAITFSLNNQPIYYDHSDLSKPLGIPDSYESEGETPINTAALTWHGFYIPKVRLELPQIIKNEGGTPVVIEGNNLIIDNNGLTGIIQNQGALLEINKGSLNGWYASIDKVNLNLFKSAFKNSSMDGKLVLPGSANHNDASNQLDYRAELTSPSGGNINYKFIVKEKDNVAFDVLFMTLKLNDCDLVVTGDFNSAPKADLNLSGAFSIANDPVSKIKVPGIKDLRLPHILFQNFHLMTYGNFVDLSKFSASFASPDKSLAGFKFTISAIMPGLQGSDIRFPFRGTLDFAMIPGMSFKADAGVSFLSGFEMKQSGRIGFKTPSARIDDISLGTAADLGAFRIKGAIKYYYKNENEIISEGFVGALETSVASLLTLNMRAHFGYTSTEGGFKFFDFNAMADLGQTGINFCPPAPLALYGFGGGFAYNMEIDRSSVPSPNTVPVKEKTDDTPTLPDKASSEKDPNPADDALRLLDFNPSGIKMTPKKGSSSLQATVLFGLTSRNTLDADANFTISFNNSAGLSAVNLTANARVLTDISKPLSERTNFSTGAGRLVIDYNVPAKTFNAGVEIKFGVPNVGSPSLLSAYGTMNFIASPQGWNFKFGNPDPSVDNNAGVTILGLLKGKSYFQVGTYQIDNMPDIPPMIYELAGQGERNQRALLQKSKQGNRTYRPGSSESGLITGSLATLGDPNKEYTFLFFYGKLFMMTGFDLSIKNGKSCLGTDAAGGAGGWYAEGQAYMGASADVGIKVNVLLIKGKFPIFKAGAAAFIQAGLPNPFFARGAVGGQFSILNGTLKGNFSLPFTIGEKCIDTNADEFAGLDIISEVHPTVPSNEEVDVSATFGAVFNLESGKAFTIDDWDRANDDGIPETRYFLFDRDCITATLNGQEINKSFLKAVDSERLTYVYDSPEFLRKETNYTWKITAKLKEGKPTLKQGVPNSPESWFNPNNIHIPYSFVKKQRLLGVTYVSTGEDATQEKSVSLRTNKGFERIRPEDYAYTTPLHSNKSVLTNADMQMEIVTKRNIEDGYLNHPEGTQYVATIYQNGARIGGDIPVRRDVVTQQVRHASGNTMVSGGQTFNRSELTDVPRSRWWFNAPVGLQPSSNYEVRVVAKLPSQGSQRPTTGTRETTTELSNQGYSISTTVSERVLNTRLMREINNDLRPIVARFSFTTSAYRDVPSKIAALAIERIEKNDGGVIISRGLSQSQNRANFVQLIQPVSGVYTIRTGSIIGFNFPVKIYLSGERYSEVDIRDVNSDKVFQTSSVGGLGGTVIIPAINLAVSENEKRSRDNAIQNKLLDFIAAQTGIARTQLRYEYTSAQIPQSTGNVSWSMSGGNQTDYIGTPTQVGGPVYVADDAPAAGATGGSPASSGNSSATASPLSGNNTLTASLSSGLSQAFSRSAMILNVDVPQFVDKYGPSMAKAEVRGERVVGNPVQIVINQRVNPADRYSTPGINNSQIGSIGTWQNVSAIANNAANNMNVSNQQLKAGVGGALLGGGFR